MEYKAIKWEVRANPLRPDERSIGVITLNRPDFLNAVDVRMRVELDILLDEIKHQSHIKVVILTGEGRGFSAGGDLKSEAGPLGAGPEDFDMGNFQGILARSWSGHLWNVLYRFKLPNYLFPN